ncbi:MAG: hypothetical protein ACYC3L_02475 [Gemmatimonadaceae bacterium]
MLLVAAVRPVAAQGADSARALQDSLAARVERAEEAIEMLRQQLAAQAESGVSTRSGLKLEVSGRILMNIFSNTHRTNNTDLPLFVLPDTANGLPSGGAGMAIRQTTLNLAVTASKVLGAQFLGDLDLDFYGGQQPSAGGRTFPLLRIRTARAILTWKHGELLVGQEVPLTSGPNPISLAAVGSPGFSTAGNLWIWLPQVRGTIERGTKVKVALQGAVLAPMTGDAAGAFSTDFDVAERSRRPFVEGRIRMRWGEGEKQAEVGISAHRGWFANNLDSLLTGQGVMADAIVPLTSAVEVRGEAFSGRGLRGLGGGQIGQLFGKNGVVVHGTGGWGQVNAKPTPRITIGAGYGFDDPDDADLPASGRLKNATAETHVIVHPAGTLVLGLEWRRITTTYTARSWSDDHLNLGVGFEF